LVVQFLNVLLGLDSAVEDGTITTCAQDVLMERKLAPLTLYPEVAIYLLSLVELQASLNENFLFLGLAIIADNVITFGR